MSKEAKVIAQFSFYPDTPKIIYNVRLFDDGIWEVCKDAESGELLIKQGYWQVPKSEGKPE